MSEPVITTPMFWCEGCGYAEIPPATDDEGRAEGEECPQCYAHCTHVTPMVPQAYAPPDTEQRGE